MMFQKVKPVMPMLAGFVIAVFSLSPQGWAAEPVVNAQTPMVNATDKQNLPGNMTPELLEQMKSAGKNAAKGASQSWIADIQSQRGTITIITGRSHLLRFNRRITRISLSDPEVIDFIILSPTEILLNAQRPGTVNLMAWDVKDEISVYDIHVTRDPGLLMALLQQIDPEGDFQIYPSEDVFVVKGFTTTVARQTQVEQAANAFAEGSVSLVQVRDPKQILLEVRFVQIDNQQDYDFGFDWEVAQSGTNQTFFSRFLPGGTQVLESDDTSTITSAQEGAGLTTNFFDANTNDIFQFQFVQANLIFGQFLEAIESKGIGRIIARPNLLVRDGQEASFLAGGEFPIVTTTSDAINVSYREFGTRMIFQPEILSDGTIRLRVEPEVSEIDSGSGLTLNSVTIPAFSVTRVRTSVELREGETFVVGGLIRQQLEVTESGVPFLRRIPIFGKVFESTDYDWEDREVIITVTPHIIWPEKQLLSEDPNTKDLLSRATQFRKFPIPHPNGNAIIDYWKDRRRFERRNHEAERKQMNQSLQALSNKYVGLDSNPGKHQEMPVEIDVPRNLDQLEEELNWPEEGAVSITEEMQEVSENNPEVMGGT